MLVKFFLTCNKIGAFTLGGGYAMIPIMEQEFVDKNKWMDKQEFMDIMVVAQTTPGIFAIDMASHIGFHAPFSSSPCSSSISRTIIGWASSSWVCALPW